MMPIKCSKFPNLRKKIDSEYQELARSFSDTWFLVLVAHLAGIILGLLLVGAAFHFHYR